MVASLLVDFIFRDPAEWERYSFCEVNCLARLAVLREFCKGVSLCDGCAGELLEQAHDERVLIWSKLPQLFDVQVAPQANSN